ncbi:efflux RND transporter periplasmic adaptor subunit [Microvirga zambiensis]|uniref:efflux RND transporter periplasmic adaptor subunit n=1 Tax=Microvirga zambiensis TaxID=1402137 RepID=UPI00191E550E|nr:efflux RND transporter periplasmic adaptor subunit [Microvirga zambiensis]
MQRSAHGVAVARIFAVALLTALAACNQKATFTPPPPPKVTVAPPLVEQIQDEAIFTGQTAAVLSVDLMARVSGFLQEASFTDGADVQKGQVLFLIEPEQYQAQVDLAQATIDQHQALLKSAEAELERQTTLQKQFVSTQANYDKALADRDSERAAVAEAQANLKTAQINLGYTKIEAPFSGRIGRRLVDPGSLVGAGGPTKLATISQLDRIYAYFTINERDIPRLQQAMRERGLTREALQTVPVFAGLSSETGTPIQGHFDFVDPVMDATTGTLQARAVFHNAKNQLIPGLFVRLRIPLGPPKPTPMVPEAAVSADQVGPYVMVVDEGSNVAMRRVSLGPSQNGLRAINSGVANSDRVIIDGLQNATPGRAVTVVAGKVASAAPAEP